MKVINEELEGIRQLEAQHEREDAFVRLAKRFSQESEAVEQRGILWRKSFEELKSWVHPIASKLRDLDEGTVSRPFLSERGWHYLFLIKRVEGKPKSYSEAQRAIEKKINISRRAIAYRRLLGRLRAKTVISISLAGDPKSEVEPNETEKAAAEPVPEQIGK